MKLTELFESIDFVPTYYDNEKKYHTSPMSKREEPCSACEGSTKNDLYGEPDQPCYYCKGTGKQMTEDYDVPYLNVANGNASLILKMLGLPQEEYGNIPNKDLPEIKRKLIAILNSQNKQQNYTRTATDTQNRQRTVTNDNGIPTIQTTGARMVDVGVDVERVRSYAERLMKVIDAAQQKGYDLSWH